MKRLVALSVLLVIAVPADAREERVLRVCADPEGLPYSNERGDGFENRIATLLAKDLGARLETTWHVARRGFFRNTLKANRCDGVIGGPKGLDMVATTRPYYRSTYAFISRRDAALGDLRSIDDPRLHSLHIGVPLVGDDGANPPPIHALGNRGMIDNVRGFHLYADFGHDRPAAVEAVERGEIDIAILWGPIAGSAAKRSPVPLVVTPILEERDGPFPFAFSIAMATRRKDDALLHELDAFIDSHRDVLQSIVRDAGTPLVPFGDARAR